MVWGLLQEEFCQDEVALLLCFVCVSHKAAATLSLRRLLLALLVDASVAVAAAAAAAVCQARVAR
jgi:hypothetical protein